MRRLSSIGMVFLILFSAVSIAYSGCEGDLNCDGDVDGSDLADFAAVYGSTNCPDCIAAPVAKTGQTNCYDKNGSIIDCTDTGQDGDLQMGVTWPDPRFTDNGDGTVTDNLTGLIWLKNANCPNGTKMWNDALTFANSLYDGWTGNGSGGDCGLSDGSSASDWRLPNVRELFSLIDFSRWYPALPASHPFTGVQPDTYWSSTTDPTHTDPPGSALHVYMHLGDVKSNPKDFNLYVWPVRGGNR